MSNVWVTNTVSGKEKITALNVLMKNIRKWQIENSIQEATE